MKYFRNEELRSRVTKTIKARIINHDKKTDLYTLEWSVGNCICQEVLTAEEINKFYKIVI